MDARLRCSVDASIGWYETIFALHGIGSELEDGLWASTRPPPPLHSDAVAVEPSVTAQQVARRIDGRVHAGVKDSFATLDLGGAGMTVLFAATWLYRAPREPRSGSEADRWTRVRTDDGLAAWTAQHNTADVLLPGLLRRAQFAVLAETVDGATVAGAVARLGSGVVDVSNVHAVAGHAVDWETLADAVWARFPGRPLVGYERGPDLEGALAGGFEPVGELRVWVR